MTDKNVKTSTTVPSAVNQNRSQQIDAQTEKKVENKHVLKVDDSRKKSYADMNMTAQGTDIASEKQRIVDGNQSQSTTQDEFDDMWDDTFDYDAGFAYNDQDGDGQITQDEFEARHPNSKVDYDDLLRRFDLDGDGVISEEEYYVGKSMQLLYKSFDYDKDAFREFLIANGYNPDDKEYQFTKEDADKLKEARMGMI